MTRSDRFMWECSGIPSVEATVSLISISLNDSSTHPLDNVRLYRNLWKVGDIIFIKVGYELIYDCPAPTPMLLMLNIHYSHADEIVKPDLLVTDPTVMITPYRDGFGNSCSRLEAPAGRIKISTSAIVRSTRIRIRWHLSPGNIRSRNCRKTH